MDVSSSFAGVFENGGEMRCLDAYYMHLMLVIMVSHYSRNWFENVC